MFVIAINHSPLNGPFFADKSQRKGIVETISRRKIKSERTRRVPFFSAAKCPQFRSAKRKSPPKIERTLSAAAILSVRSSSPTHTSKNKDARAEENEGTKLFSPPACVLEPKVCLIPHPHAWRGKNMIQKVANFPRSLNHYTCLPPAPCWSVAKEWVEARLLSMLLGT